MAFVLAHRQTESESVKLGHEDVRDDRFHEFAIEHGECLNPVARLDDPAAYYAPLAEVQALIDQDDADSAGRRLERLFVDQLGFSDQHLTDVAAPQVV